ncbi:expressed unknown protein [Seminavis robusta]|uniref:Uncharacterized protein n=1 Tax=Seminavis robusta TaxID=568900 RepID=A0A9N8H5D2_9STRA|nr:expressed unknown protein [Seminavis robusta]|eukprot:Sro21_g014800.1 n/a (380) ;mRNA; f:105208-106347
MLRRNQGAALLLLLLPLLVPVGQSQRLGGGRGGGGGRGRGRQRETEITSFSRPEDLVNLRGTPYLVVSEFGTPSRSDTGAVSLLNVNTNERIPLWTLPEGDVASTPLSPMADPTCTPRPMGRIGPHGIDAYDNRDGTWEVAIVNHFAYESIEFYHLNFNNPDGPLPLFTKIGCTYLRNGDVHNDLSYSSDKSSIVVTLWYNNYFGTRNQLFTVAVSILGVGTDGSIKRITRGGQVNTIVEGFNGPNGVFVHPDNNQIIYVSESPRDQIVVVNARLEDVETNTELECASIPDNISAYPGTNSFLVTRIDSGVPRTLICSTGVRCPPIRFSVLQYDYQRNRQTVLYSGSMRGQPSVAVIKGRDLFVGTFSANVILRVSNVV